MSTLSTRMPEGAHLAPLSDLSIPGTEMLQILRVLQESMPLQEWRPRLHLQARNPDWIP
jgi:hypothetical protein